MVFLENVEEAQLNNLCGGMNKLQNRVQTIDFNKDMLRELGYKHFWQFIAKPLKAAKKKKKSETEMYLVEETSSRVLLLLTLQPISSHHIWTQQ